ncbi:MAG: sugar phosphate isomerase/epimerase [Armatimonadetes bacterium]|nr:sugar phosphate isomerase/epimerase [Armatimonadota bacterium]
MQVGILTAPFRDETMDTVVAFASEAGFDALEIDVRPGAGPLNVAEFDEAQAADTIAGVRDAGLVISALACYVNISDADEAARAEARANLRKAIAMAAANDIDVVCCTAGLPPDGMSREETIEQVAAPFFKEVCAEAADRGIRLALENRFATNIMHLEQWDLMFDTVGADNFGLNFDPSHLYWMGIDYLWAVEKFAERIFHTHGKDTEVLAHRLRVIGNQSGRGWWRYVIPGYGEIDWGVYIARLRDNGYDGVISIEHEDRAFGREEGFLKGLRHLRQFT